MATTNIISIHAGKGKTAYQSIKDRLDYIMNPEKTDGGILISSHACCPETAADEFMLYRQEYLNAKMRYSPIMCVRLSSPERSLRKKQMRSGKKWPND